MTTTRLKMALAFLLACFLLGCSSTSGPTKKLSENEKPLNPSKSPEANNSDHPTAKTDEPQRPKSNEAHPSVKKPKESAQATRTRVVKLVEELGGEVEMDGDAIVGIDLSESEATNDEHLKTFALVESVRTLDLSSTSISDLGLAHLAGLKNLRRLNVGTSFRHDNCVSDEGLRLIADHKLLERLSVYNTRITDAGLEHLKSLVALRSLDLQHTDITGKGLRHLSQLPMLEQLNLYNTECTDEGVSHAANLPSLTHLLLDRTRVGDEAIGHLAKSPLLERLTLTGTRITNQAAPRLVQLKALKSLSLADTLIWYDHVEKLAQQLTDVKVYHPALEPMSTDVWYRQRIRAHFGRFEGAHVIVS